MMNLISLKKTWKSITQINVSGRANVLLNLIHHQLDVGKICLHAKTPDVSKYQLDKREDVTLKHFNNPQVFIKYLIWMIFIELFMIAANKNGKLLIIFYDMIADMLNNKNVKQ